MLLKKLSDLGLLLACSATLYGCASSVNNTSAPRETPSASTSTQTEMARDNSKAAKKISMAIGREISDFSIVNKISTDAPLGYEGTQYTVNTKNGKTYKCDILENSGLGKVMTFGMGTGADAMCTDFTKGSADAGKTNKTGCNQLLRAAGKC